VRGWADSKDERHRANFRWTFATASDQAAQFAARIESFRLLAGAVELSPSVLRRLATIVVSRAIFIASDTPCFARALRSKQLSTVFVSFTFRFFGAGEFGLLHVVILGYKTDKAL
jgi:hypothetical protein